MDNTRKFAGKAKAYSSGRPSYAPAFIDALYSEHGLTSRSVIADIGSGTGILTRQLLEKGSAVFAVEPNADMRGAAERALKTFTGFRSVNGTAENTALGDNSVDCITVAQAFHWFDVMPFKKECTRILRPNGKIFLVWNCRDECAAINIDQSAVFGKFCPDFKGFGGGIQNDDDRIHLFFDNAYTRVTFDNPLLYDREKYIERCLSSSYSLTPDDDSFERYIRELNGLFDKHAVNSVLTIPNATVAYYAKATV